MDKYDIPDIEEIYLKDETIYFVFKINKSLIQKFKKDVMDGLYLVTSDCLIYNAKIEE